MIFFSGYVTDVALPSNGKYFVSAENDQKVVIWNLNSRVVIHKDIQINVAQLLIIEDFTPHLILGMEYWIEFQFSVALCTIFTILLIL